MSGMWFLSPSGWPVYADSAEEQDELAARGYDVITEGQVQAAIDAFHAAEASPPSTQLPGWALASDVAAALATKANASSLPGKLSISDISNPATSGGAALRAAFASALSAQQYPKWRLALGKVRAGTADAKLLVIGDSTSAGSGSANATSPPLTSWSAKLATLLNSQYIPTQLGLGAAPRNGSPTFDGRWAAGTGWTSSGGGFDSAASWLASAATSGPLVFTPGAVAGTHDTFDVYYAGIASATTLEMTATGSAPQTINVPGTLEGAGVMRSTVSAAAAGTGNSVAIKVTAGGPIWVIGVEPYLSTARKVRIGNGAIPGGGAGGAADTANGFGGLNSLQKYAPDLTVIMLGINDAANSGGVAAFGANVQKIIDAGKVSGDVVLASFIPSYDDGTLGPNEALLLPILRQLAASNSVGLIDVNARWVSYAVSNPLGFYADVVHGSDLGYWDIAHLMYRSLLSI